MVILSTIWKLFQVVIFTVAPIFLGLIAYYDFPEHSMYAIQNGIVQVLYYGRYQLLIQASIVYFLLD